MYCENVLKNTCSESLTQAKKSLKRFLSEEDGAAVKAGVEIVACAV
jgi:hypothetical protein